MVSRSLKGSGKRKGTHPFKKSHGTGKCSPICKVLLLASAMGIAKLKNPARAPDRFYKAKVGRFTKTFDKALPGPHTRLLYNGKRKIQANILCQLRSGINRLNKYLAKINAVESDQCKCGRGEESVDHFLFRCPRWSIFRGEIRRLAGRRWGDTPYLLGGWSGEPKDGDAVLQLLPAGSKIGGREGEKVMMSNRNQTEKATRGPNKQKKPTQILNHSPTNQRASGPPRRYRRCMTIDNRNITRGSEQPL